MPKAFNWKSMVGNQYGKWVVLEVCNERNSNGKVELLCQCTCEQKTVKKVSGTLVKRGSSNSCGCYQRQRAKEGKTKHGMSYHPLHTTWMNMKQRCTNKNKRDYQWYGGSHISVCDKWVDDFMNFYNWSINNGWREGLEIDRTDYTGDYEPNNCQWITQQENKECGKRRMSRDNKSGYTGVYLFKESNKYIASLNHDGNKYYLGIFKTPEEAVEVRIAKEIELFGEQRTNFHYKK